MVAIGGRCCAAGGDACAQGSRSGLRNSDGSSSGGSVGGLGGGGAQEERCGVAVQCLGWRRPLRKWRLACCRRAACHSNTLELSAVSI